MDRISFSGNRMMKKMLLFVVSLILFLSPNGIKSICYGGYDYDPDCYSVTVKKVHNADSYEFYGHFSTKEGAIQAILNTGHDATPIIAYCDGNTINGRTGFASWKGYLNAPSSYKTTCYYATWNLGYIPPDDDKELGPKPCP
ncbi:MAG: hypothetical protein GY860_26910 [Desulfobacteraceae bacterium]|nr:hypothetical protein [Desulfobacteraceae bacterium]